MSALPTSPPDPSSAHYHQSRVPQVYGGTIPLIVLATFIVGLRMYSRRLTSAQFWWDDWTLVLALVLCWGLSACYWIEVDHAGLGRHTATSGGPVGPMQLVTFNKIFLAIQVLYFSCAVAIKTSLILLYHRIFGVVRWFRAVLAAAWAIVVLYFIVDLLVAIFECTPVEYYWDKTIATGKCIDQNAFYRWNGVANLLIDFMILCLTMPMVWRLNLETKQKLSLSAIFLLGLFACAASIVRVVAFDFINQNDITYTIVTASVWTTIEQSVGIICACLPTLRPVMGRVFDTVKSHNRSGSYSLTDMNGADRSKHSKRSQMSNLSWKTRSRSDDTDLGVGGGGFSKLDEEQLVGSRGGIVESHAARIPSGDVPVVPERIMKNQTIEQHRAVRL